MDINPLLNLYKMIRRLGIVWHKNRQEFLCDMIEGIIRQRAVIFSEIAEGIDHPVETASIERRIQDFFQKVSIEYNQLVYFFLSFIHHDGLVLSIDRTEWDFGKTQINILCVVVSIGKMAVPLYFEMLDNNSGNSHHTDRISLFQDLIKLIEKVSQTDASVLILGENGTGKQHFARQIHQRSARSDGPFIHVDLGAITETLFESELFGHKRGSFTDAIEDKPGLFELAQHGTLFLDEVANLSYKLQAKLLTALQEKKTSRIGEGKQRPFDARLLFATNANLYEMVEEGSFRQDLLFRINTVELQIPPLRERLADVKEFAEHFLHIYSERYGKPHLKLSAEAMDSLVTHGWPGNIREIQHTIERGVIMAEGSTIEPADFSLTKTSKKGDTDLDTLNLHELEKMLVLKALEKHNSNISKAAKELGITRAALYRRMEKFNI